MNENLGPSSSIEDVIKEIEPESGVRVVPTSVPAEDGKARFAILIAGKADDANVILANLMSYVDTMFQTAQDINQQQLVGSDGKPIEDEPTIIVP